MIVFCWKKCCKILNFYCNRFIKFFRIIEIFDKLCCEIFFFLILCVDCRRIVISTICKLSIRLSRINLCEVEFDEFFIRHKCRIVYHFYCFTMSCDTCPHFLIACIFLISSCISYNSLSDSILGLKNPLHTPEASSSKICSRVTSSCLFVCCHSCIAVMWIKYF